MCSKVVNKRLCNLENTRFLQVTTVYRRPASDHSITRRMTNWLSFSPEAVTLSRIHKYRLPDNATTTSQSAFHLQRRWISLIMRPVHLLVLIHGMWGHPGDLAELNRVIRETYPETDDTLEILLAESNRDESTYDGIDWGGERVTQEVLSSFTWVPDPVRYLTILLTRYWTRFKNSKRTGRRFLNSLLRDTASAASWAAMSSASFTSESSLRMSLPSTSIPSLRRILDLLDILPFSPT